MKKIKLLSVAAILALTLCACQKPSSSNTPTETLQAVGMTTANSVETVSEAPASESLLDESSGGLTSGMPDETSPMETSLETMDETMAETTSEETEAETTKAPRVTDGILSVFTATDLDGNPVDASIFADHKLTMINVWGTFCGPCLNEMPDLAAISAEYEEVGFQIIGIPVDVMNFDGSISDEMVTTARGIIEQTGANYLHLLPSEDLNRILLNQVYYIPHTIFVDENGVQVGEEAYIGSLSKEAWITIIEGLLAEVG